ncbi:Trehalase precursor, putative [Pediculus humanus corporis]|uniref:Trehalase n=1 Tax=Pediculus humanus subsp. corporis TaxID=121224 RepID=E0W4A8_PEDHC|nr:Trehalase precursor, putative [Pediculus humanus corporis]EEB20464.1 Trehalase precursor, putative [Pediculus humanus corporis]
MFVLKTKTPTAVACSNCFQLFKILKRNQSSEVQPCFHQNHHLTSSDPTTKCNVPIPTNSEIYCHGRLLHTIQMAQLYNDSKTFVDKKLKYKPAVTLEKFNVLMQETEDRPTRKQLQDFVNDYFEDGNELEAWTPPDWTPHPQFVDNIIDPNYRKWALDLNNLWTNLTRKMIVDVKNNPDQYSIVYVPNGLVIPGGRFTEFYYWDTYWIVRGLLLSEMYETVRGILLNFLSMVSQYGFVPNGGRVYYLERSQPPLLTPMVLSYYEATNDIDFLQSHICLLEKEFNFWVKNRTVEVYKGGKKYKLARYFAPSSGPRPESYSEDYNSAAFLPTQLEKEDLYMDLKSAAESGWDFSSRWFITNKTNQGNISSIHTRYIIPVDLNAFIYWNAKILSQFYEILQNYEKSVQYSEIAEYWLEAVTAVLWHSDLGIWLDYDIRNNIRRDYFYPSNLAPLWTECYDKKSVNKVARSVIQYLDDSNIMVNFLGGLPASLEMTGQQWDRPNAWPPLQIIAIQGLNRMNVPEASDIAKELAKNWVYSNFKGFHDSNEMFEKYDAENPGRYGSGGEYIVQAGFGWTNGVIMELLNTYGKELQCSDKDICDLTEPIKQNGLDK